jgi:hypothetical protein
MRARLLVGNRRYSAVVVRPDVHDDLPVRVRPREVPRHPRSSPPACGEIRASKRGVEPSSRKVQSTSPQHQAKSAASLTDSRKGATGSRAWHYGAKAMDGVKHLERNPQEPGGVRDAEWWESRRGNRRDPSPPQQ